MTPDAMFGVWQAPWRSSWLLLVVTPGRRVVAGVVASALVPLLFAVVYVAILVPRMGSSDGSFSTLDGLRSSSPIAGCWSRAGCTTGIFDLFLELAGARRAATRHPAPRWCPA